MSAITAVVQQYAPRVGSAGVQKIVPALELGLVRSDSGALGLRRQYGLQISAPTFLLTTAAPMTAVPLGNPHVWHQPFPP